MAAIFETAKHLEQGIITVFDIDIKKYRSINIYTLESISIENITYTKYDKNNFEYISIDYKKNLITSIEVILEAQLSIFQKAWSVEQLIELYEKLLELDTIEIEVAKAIFEYENGIDCQAISDIQADNLEFFSNITLEDLANFESYSLLIPPPENINISYIPDYKPTADDLSEYYYEASNGVVQMRGV